jgi:hypothetical protein
MSDKLSFESIVRDVADRAARRVARKSIAALQKLTGAQSGDDSALKTVWDEICVQMQFEQSPFWDYYDAEVRRQVADLITALPKHEREAIWLQTDAGSSWECDEPENRAADPVDIDQIVEYVVPEYVYEEAGRWSNSRIRAFIEESGWA